MVHEHLQLYLPKHLLLHICLLNLYFAHHLQRVQETSVFLLGEVNVAEATAA